MSGLVYTGGATPFRAVVEGKATAFLTGLADLSATIDRRSEWRCVHVGLGGVAAVCDNKPVMWPCASLSKGLKGVRR